MELRNYQAEAVRAAQAALLQEHNPVIEAATGAGKSLMIAALAARLPGRVLVATHRQKLLKQNSETLLRLAATEDIGVYSAGLDRREGYARVVFGGIQSIYQRIGALQRPETFSWVIVDECHLVPPPGQASMYRTLFEGLPDTSQLVGFSATPSRMGVPVYGRGKDSWFTSCPYQIGMRDLTPRYLAPLVEMQHATDIDLHQIAMQRGEYVAADASRVMSETTVAEQALDEICLLAAQRTHWAFFCCDIAHTRLVATLLSAKGIACGTLLSDQDDAANAAALEAFARGELRAIASCVMMTTGFDVPGIDCVVLLRPTASRELLIQMLGRGTRQSAGKTDCLVLDYCGNIARLQPFGVIAETRQTEARRAIEAQKRREQAAHIEQERLAKHQATLFASRGLEEHAVVTLDTAVTPSKTQPGRSLLVVTYLCLHGKRIKTWVCIEYRGFARQKAEEWFARRSVQCPTTAAEAADLVRTLPRPVKIFTRVSASGFLEVVTEIF